MPVETGSILGGRYQLHEVLGRGGMADVYRAEDQLLHRSVAVKVLREETEDDNDRARFTAEARTLASLAHRGLVVVLDAGISVERPYLVMELVAGDTLASRCSGRALPVHEVATIGGQVAAAIAYAHGRGIVHRDVKPGNVLMGTDGRVKLADFGIARLLGDTVRHTRTGHAIGTAAYLAPEQVQGQEVTTAVDVYSLGLVMLEALTGERAYPGPPTEAALARLSRPPEIPPELPEAWRRLLAQMTALEPSARPTADEVASVLAVVSNAVVPNAAATVTPAQSGDTALLTHADVAAPAASERGRILDRVRRVPVPYRVLAAVVVTLLVLMVVAALVSDGGGPTPARKIPADTPTRLQAPLQRLHDAVDEAGR